MVEDESEVVMRVSEDNWCIQESFDNIEEKKMSKSDGKSIRAPLNVLPITSHCEVEPVVTNSTTLPDTPRTLNLNGHRVGTGGRGNKKCGHRALHLKHGSAWKPARLRPESSRPERSRSCSFSVFRCGNALRNNGYL